MENGSERISELENQLAAAVKRISTLEKNYDYGDVSNRVNRCHCRIGAVENQLAAVKGENVLIRGFIDPVMRRLERLEKDFHVATTVGGLGARAVLPSEEELQEIHDAVMETRPPADRVIVSERVAEWLKTVKEIDPQEEVPGLRQRLDALTDRVGAVSTRLEAISRAVLPREEADQLFTALAERVNVLENAVASAPPAVAPKPEAHEALAETMRQLDQRLASHRSTVAHWAARVLELERWRDRPEGPVPVLAQRVKTLEEGRVLSWMEQRDVPLTTSAHTVPVHDALRGLGDMVAAARAVHRLWVSGDPEDRDRLARAVEHLGTLIGERR